VLYLKRDFNLQLARPASRDRFVERAQQQRLPGLERLDGRLVNLYPLPNWPLR